MSPATGASARQRPSTAPDPVSLMLAGGLMEATANDRGTSSADASKHWLEGLPEVSSEG